MKKYIIAICLFTITNYAYSQGNAGIGKQVVDNAAALDLSNNTNKAFLPARVTLTDLFSNSTPVNNPAEGLIVYNVGASQPKGFYIWNNGSWSLMAAKENSVTNAVIQNTNKLTGFALPMAPTYVPLTGGTQLFNSISGFTSTASNFTLPPGNYSVQVTLNIETPETTSGGIGNTVFTHIHYYSAKLSQGATTYGQVMSDNQISNTSSTVNGKQHVATFFFTFQLTTTSTMAFNIARNSGGTYSGNINVLNSFIHVQRSML